MQEFRRTHESAMPDRRLPLSYVKTTQLHWQYTQRPDRAFANLHLGLYPTQRPPVPPFFAKKKKVEVVEEQMDFARMEPAKDYFEPYKEPEMISPPLRAACELVWEPFLHGWKVVEPWVLFLWSLMWLVFVWVVEGPAQWLYEFWMRIEWWNVLALVFACLVASLFPAPGAGIVEDVADVGGEIVYILMVPYAGPGGGYTGPVL